ncbi:hypothetical protein EG68_02164 [Paragonimus skrjabini miyazakii]|uniref:Sushi domain-containing protein n=1 Tax=Paragonimus skrjabini miyazakii TaxID=59628 RepID=A0A8S9Z648_9TREM|nr:hypothetical protein EG68_02164 [Paragonimus skrjabini miyazakii]
MSIFVMLRTSFLFITIAFQFPRGSGISVVNGICEPRSHSHPDFPKCPSKVCRQHIDCWVSYGPPQSCVCDPHLCGPVCLPETAKCPPPSSPQNGTVTFNGTDVGDAAEYSCAPGLVVRGPRSRHCLATLSWSGDEPSCSNQTNACFSPPYMPNTQVIPKSYAPDEVKFPVALVNRDDYRSGETIEVMCLPGYRDSNRNLVEVTCVGSEWQFNKLNCERIACSPLRDPVHGKVVYKSDMKFQAEAISFCFHNYVADCEGQMKVDEASRGCIRSCQADGQWSGNDVLCKPVTCPKLDAPENGGVSTYSTHVNSVVHVHCNEGFELLGVEHRKCQATGKWDGEPAVCKQRDCGSPPVILNGKLQVNETTFGSKALIECPPDTTPSSQLNVMQCGVLGNRTTWLPQPTPACNRHCYLFTVDHGNVILMHKPNTPSQRLIPISTDDYSRPMDASENFRPNPLDGIILPYGRVRHGSQLNVTCNPGYQLIKSVSPVTTCHDGVWSVRSQCVPASCQTRPPVVRGARVRFYSRDHNAKARYECFAGHRLQVDTTRMLEAEEESHDKRDPIGIIRCNYGQWIGTPVICEPILCPSLVINEMVTVDLKRLSSLGPVGAIQHVELKEGTVAHLHCPKGYHISGSSFAVCHNGDWSPSVEKSKCERSTHELPPTEWFFRLP